MACGNSFHFAGQIVIPQDITQFMALLIFTHCRGLMCLGSIAVFRISRFVTMVSYGLVTVAE